MNGRHCSIVWQYSLSHPSFFQSLRKPDVSRCLQMSLRSLWWSWRGRNTRMTHCARLARLESWKSPVCCGVRGENGSLKAALHSACVSTPEPARAARRAWARQWALCAVERSPVSRSLWWSVISHWETSSYHLSLVTCHTIIIGAVKTRGRMAVIANPLLILSKLNDLQLVEWQIANELLSQLCDTGQWPVTTSIQTLEPIKIPTWKC